MSWLRFQPGRMLRIFQPLRHRRTRILAYLFLIGEVLVGIGVVNYCGAGRWLVVPPNPHPADAIVIPGYGKTRTSRGFDLFDQGFAPEIWYTGWMTFEVSPAVKAAMEAHHIPDEVVHPLVTTSTWEDGREVAAFARQRGVRSILVVTDWYHSRRALCVIRHHLKGSGVSVSYAEAGKPYPNLETWWKKGNPNYGLVDLELKKLAYYFVRYGLPLWEC
ncbi:MAG: YdcF family protein [Chloroflexaceae bacterium]|nr:YdcF family protein [Chloroflexaceae bacterium]